jgi:hypothetical protein
MLETYFSASKMLGHLRSGPSGPFLDDFAAALERQGYGPETAVRYLRAAAHLGHVMVEQGAGLTDIDLAAVGKHLRTCRCPRAKGGRRNHHTIYGARLFRRHLVELGVCWPCPRWQHPPSRSWSPTSRRGCASIAVHPIPPSGNTPVTLPA